MNLGRRPAGKGRRRRGADASAAGSKADPNNANIQYELGQTLRQSGDLPGAIAAFEKALQIDPELREGYYGLGLALKQQSAAKRRFKPSAGSPRTILYKRAQEAASQVIWTAASSSLAEALRLDE